MILKRTITIVLAIFMSNIAISQLKGGRVIYQASTDTRMAIKKLNKNESIPENYKKKILYDLEKAEDIQFNLDFNENESLFYYSGIFALENEGNRGSGHTGLIAGAGNTYYTNLDTKKIFKQNRHFNKLLIIQEPSVWNMIQETKTIGEYICFKATTTIKVEGRNGVMYRSIVAWYTPQIPVPYGIQGFTNLPGLTLELKINNNITFKALKIELNPKEKVEIEKPNGKKITSEEYNDMLKGVRAR
ncbi:MAG: GLPGLI family protein [Bacteroidetes bacterium]|nr:GLPGLI family protein [Bacteroidota bacterium]